LVRDSAYRCAWVAIGIDPHKGSHTAVVLDRSETVIGELGVSADGRQRDRLLEFAAAFTPRTWAIESASGLGALLAQQLVAAGETVLDVPPTLSARVRLLDAGTTVTDIHGIGPLGAAIILGHTGDIARFPTSGHYARYNGSAPIAASSGPRQRHRLNPRGNRQLNRALHVAAVTQVRNDT
jgi:transposase